MAGPSGAQESVEEFQRLLFSQARIANAEVIRAYAPVYRQLQKDTLDLMRIAERQGLKPWQAMRMERMKSLERQFLTSARKFTDAAGDTITESQRAAVGLGRRGAEEAVTAGLPPGITTANLSRLGLDWNRLPDDAFTNFVGIAADGKPIGNLLAPLGKEAAEGVKDAIGTGIALGKGPRKTAQLVRVAAGMPLSKALLITRTETNRAFREATRLQYANNSQVVKGYRRRAAQSDRTCMACIALDGTLYALDEPLNEHPNGRCALVPDTITYQDLGLDVEMPPEPENARDWLGRQPEGTQRKVLGDTRYEAIQRGELHMGQLATVRQNAVWGDAAVVRSLRDLGLREGVGIKPPPPALGRPPVSPTGDLVDPMTNLPVRGNRTTPPEIDADTLGQALPPEIDDLWEQRRAWDVAGRKDEFLDTEPYALRRSLIQEGGGGFNPQEVGDTIQKMVREQETWARAVGGAVEADYTGLSVKAARDTNLAIERTILRHNMRPLDRIATGPYSDHPDLQFAKSTLAYQYKGNVHINLNTTVNGSVRGWSDMAVRAQRRTAEKLVESRKALTELEAEIITRRSEIQQGIAARRSALESNRAAGRLTESEILDEERLFARWDVELKGKEKEWRASIRDHKNTMREVESGRWGVYSGGEATGIESTVVNDLITHEIGHFAHRRYGFHDPTSLATMATRKKVYKTRTRYNPRTGRTTVKKQWEGAYEPQKEASKISEYGTTNDHEYFAEAWADYHANDGIHLTDKVRGFIEEVIEANAQFPDVALSDRAYLGVLNRVRKRSGEEAARSLIGRPLPPDLAGGLPEAAILPTTKQLALRLAQHQLRPGPSGPTTEIAARAAAALAREEEDS